MTMSLREMNLCVFQHQPIPHVFFQPRFEPWFAWHEQFDSLPPELRGMSLRQVYDMLGASMRSVHYYTGQPNPIATRFTDEVRITEQSDGERTRICYQTPHGPLYQTQQLTVDRTWRTVEFAAKTADDLPALRWLLARRVISFDIDAFRQGAAYVGERGVPQFWVPKSPYLALAQQWMKYEHFIYALADHPALINEIMDIIDQSYDPLYEQLCSSGLLQILNFGENIAAAYLSRRYLERYLIPWYEKRSGQLRAAGIFTHVHIDGYFRLLLPYLSTLPFDGLEALTPLPQGDVSLDEMRAHMGDKVLLDGIPAVLFMSYHPREELYACVERVVELFHPRLVLGISDELPEGGGAEAFERLRWVAEWCRTRP